MERIKKALEEARLQRERTLRSEYAQLRARHAAGTASAAARFDAATEARIRDINALRVLSPARVDAIVALGQVFGLASGESVLAAGEETDARHFLIEGAVQYLAGEQVVRRLAADGPGAHEALDDAGPQPWAVVTERPSRILRVPRELFEGELPRLAVAAAGPPQAAAGDAPRLPEPPPPAAGRERLGEALRLLEQRVRAHVQAQRARERAACEEKTRRHVEALKGAAQAELRRRYDELKQRAEAELRRKLGELRRRDRERLLEHEARLRERHAVLQRIARRYAHEKTELQHARRQLEDKLRAAEALHRELAELGRAVSLQLEDLDSVFDGEGAPLLESTLSPLSGAD